ncbi:MAG: FAD/NAD(P)-binding protein [Pseudomonadota bacterium]
MKRYNITVVGMGPRGLSVLERLAAHALEHQLALDISLVEPGECGQGVHSARQPQHLLINTVASQVTLFPAPGAVELPPHCATPSLTEWARQSGYRRVGDQYYRIGATGAGAEIGEADYLPRRLLGEYLTWGYEQILASLPPNVTLRHHRLRANDMWQQPDGRCAVELDSGFILISDYVFLTTGHSNNAMTELESACARFAQEHARHNSKLAYIRHVYPLDKLVQIDADARVAIQGLGLTAHDVIAELTVGRGGQFVREGQTLRYQKSGREPQLMLFSRNCLPFAARGVNQKGLAGRHRPHYFTPDAVAALRERALRERGCAQLDFDLELLPLLRREMGYVYRATLDGAGPEPAAYQLSEEEGAIIDVLLFPLRGREFASLAEFRDYFDDWLRRDLAEAVRGNVGSAVKAATDVLRDVRATWQAALEHAGLTPASHRKFLNVYNPVINRISFGPPRQRNEQLLALREAGVVDIVSGPGGSVGFDETAACFELRTRFGGGQERRPFDVLAVARLDVFSPQTDESVFMQNLLRRGLVRPYYNGVYHPGGIDIEPGGRVLGAAGRPLGNVWALGYLVEGAHYYTHALPRPQLASRQVLDADRCVGAMFDAIAANCAAGTDSSTGAATSRQPGRREANAKAASFDPLATTITTLPIVPADADADADADAAVAAGQESGATPAEPATPRVPV